MSTAVPSAPAAAPSAAFWDRIAPRYARQPIADEAAYEHKLALTRAALGPDASVLEIGCGTGSTALRHAPHVARIRATDLSARMIEIARAKAAEASAANVTFEQASIETLAVETGGVDAVLALSLLHLIEDRAAGLRKIHAWLKPGGAFVSSTACLGDMGGILKHLIPAARLLGLAPRVWSFTGEQLRAEVRAAGFEIETDWRPGPGKALFLIARKPA